MSSLVLFYYDVPYNVYFPFMESNQFHDVTHHDVSRIHGYTITIPFIFIKHDIVVEEVDPSALLKGCSTLVIFCLLLPINKHIEYLFWGNICRYLSVAI